MKISRTNYLEVNCYVEMIGIVKVKENFEKTRQIKEILIKLKSICLDIIIEFYLTYT